MAKKKQKKSPSKNKKRSLLIPILLGVFVAFTFCGLLYFMLLRPDTVAPPTQPKQIAQKQTPTKPAPPKISPPPPKKEQDIVAPKQTEAPPVDTRPRVAIIIDDIGYTKKYANKIIDFDLNLTFSILPLAPHAKKLVERIIDNDREIILHQPMEATDKKWNLGPSGLLLSMSKSQLIRKLKENIEAVPMAMGLNNHMGSKFSQDPAAMRVVLEVARSQDLFFVDSLTSPKSVGYRLAKDMGIKTIKRDIFLDNSKDEKKIINQLKLLIKLAKKTGQAVGIGHPYAETYSALNSFQENLKNEVNLVRVSKLVE